MFLNELHRKKLQGSGLSPDTIVRAGFYSAPEAETREILGYGVGSGLVIPYDERFGRVRIDNAGPDGKRYRTPRGGSNRVYVPRILVSALLTEATKTLYITEGEFKALKATQEGFPCIALPGVWSWKRRVHGQSLTVSDLDRIEWRERIVVIVFDSDITEKPPVAWAEHALVQELRRRGANVFVMRLPSGEKGEKYGLDDYLVAFGAEAFRKLPMQTLKDADRKGPTVKRVGELADDYVDRTQSAHHRIKMGGAFDRVIRGIAPGEVMTILGRSGVGKTAFGLNIIHDMTTQKRLPALVFSLEMQGPEVFERMASMQTGIPGREIEALAMRDDPMLDELFYRVIAHWNHVVVIDEPCSLDKLDQLIGETRLTDFWTEPLRLVVVDYMGLISPTKRGTLYEQVSEVARELKCIAKRHQIALVVICQVGRTGESGGEPVTVSSARDSGVIEEAADYLVGIWRPELEDGISPAEREARRGMLKATILKNRCGPAPRTIDLQLTLDTLKITGSIAEFGA